MSEALPGVVHMETGSPIPWPASQPASLPALQGGVVSGWVPALRAPGASGDGLCRGAPERTRGEALSRGWGVRCEV